MVALLVSEGKSRALLKMICEKSPRKLHEFPYLNADCLHCGVNQKVLSNPKGNKTRGIKLGGIDKKDFFARLEERKKLKLQHTRHQQDAIDTAKMFDDMKSKGIYFKLFKKHNRENLLKCREWVNKNGKGNKGRLFVSVYKKFV